MFRRRQQQDEGSAPPNVYKMRQSLISIGDDYWIENGAGQRAFKVDGKAFRIRKTLVIEDTAGQEVATLKEKLVSVRDVMTIERGGQVLATVKKALFTPLRERFEVEGARRQVRRQGQHHRPPVRLRARRPAGRVGLDEMVPRPRHVRRRDRPERGRARWYLRRRSPSTR